MRILRVILAIALAAIAIIVIVWEQLAGASANAVVNANVTTLRTPIAGEISLTGVRTGVRVAQGEQLGIVSDPLADTVRLNDLMNQRANIAADAERLASDIEAKEQLSAELASQAAVFSFQRVAQLEARLSRMEAQISSRESMLDAARVALERARELEEKGLQSEANLETQRTSAIVAQTSLDEAIAERDETAVQLEAARAGYFTGDGTNDISYSARRQSELQLEVRQARAMRSSLIETLEAIDTRIASEQRRVNKLTSTVLLSNVNGRIWTIDALSGETLQRGQPILHLVDCDSIMITLSVTEGVYNDLMIGDPADFRFMGGREVYSGTVIRLAGNGAIGVYDGLAVAPSEAHLERFDVAVHVSDLEGMDGADCPIGRTGRVFFESRPFDILRDLL
jgi:multidrug resistance efflux pump